MSAHGAFWFCFVCPCAGFFPFDVRLHARYGTKYAHSCIGDGCLVAEYEHRFSICQFLRPIDCISGICIHIEVSLVTQIFQQPRDTSPF